jgi:hypothetical protein
MAAGLAAAQTCATSGSDMAGTTSRMVAALDRMASVSPQDAMRLVDQTRADLGKLQQSTACFVGQAKTQQDTCMQRMSTVFNLLAGAETQEKQLNTLINSLSVELEAAQKAEAVRQEAIRNFEAQIKSASDALESRRKELASYDWVKYICYPCKALVEAIRNDESRIESLRATIRDLQQRKDATEARATLSVASREAKAALSEAQARSKQLAEIQSGLDRNITGLKSTVAFLVEAEAFWSQVNTTFSNKNAADVKRLAMETARWLDTDTTPSATGPQARTAGRLRESLMQFSRETDQGLNLLQKGDASSCSIGSEGNKAAMFDVMRGILGPQKFQSGSGRGGTVELTALVMENKTTREAVCNFEGSGNDMDHRILYLAPRESVKYFNGKLIGARFKGNPGNSFRGGFRVSCTAPGKVINSEMGTYEKSIMDPVEGYILYRPVQR